MPARTRTQPNPPRANTSVGDLAATRGSSCAAAADAPRRSMRPRSSGRHDSTPLAHDDASAACSHAGRSLRPRPKPAANLRELQVDGLRRTRSHSDEGSVASSTGSVVGAALAAGARKRRSTADEVRASPQPDCRVASAPQHMLRPSSEGRVHCVCAGTCCASSARRAITALAARRPLRRGVRRRRRARRGMRARRARRLTSPCLSSRSAHAHAHAHLTSSLHLCARGRRSRSVRTRQHRTRPTTRTTRWRRSRAWRRASTRAATS